MSKSKTPRRLSPDSAEATLSMIRVSPRKLNLVVKTIRGETAGKALKILSFLNKESARSVKKLLLSAVANAENNHGLDPDALLVKEATVGQKMVLKRLDVKGRSKSGRITKPFSSVRLVVQEKGA